MPSEGFTAGAYREIVEYRAACRDCRAGLGEWSQTRALAGLQSRAHHHETGHDTTVQTRRTTHDDAHTTTQEAVHDG